ncbi:CGNR zinc finger domain-containing protein [Fodinicola acaciae]|uniref:CGNR zinc finger domain-containing protein n=1 Tax=Fodinicola acaciae TaxID=2681555 RepID=UPI001FE9687D|nr:CGNR zinc finger domain-containing protein [Fodinicola acaciae]
MTDLINEPPRDPADLARRWNSRDLGHRVTAEQADPHDVQDILRTWRDIVDADTEADRVRLLNALLAQAAAYPRITNHDGSGWHLHYRDDNASLAATIRAVTAVAAARHLSENGMHRLGRCTLAECRRAFVDLSRGGRQHYCTRVCANRDAVRRHRARKSLLMNGGG